MGLGGRFRKLMYLRIALVAAALIAVLVFHAHGSTLAVFQIARVALLLMLVLAVGRGRNRRRR
jgi:Flp pilus assembly protein TadB